MFWRVVSNRTWLSRIGYLSLFTFTLFFYFLVYLLEVQLVLCTIFGGLILVLEIEIGWVYLIGRELKSEWFGCLA